MRTLLRVVVGGLTAGALGVGSAVAGVAVAPVPDLPAAGTVPGAAAPAGPAPAATAALPAEPAPTDVQPGRRLPAGWFLAGTDVRSLVPPADRWTPAEQCRGQAPEQLYTPATPEGCLITFDMLWADGVDEQNPLQVRTVAVSNGEQTVTFSVVDLVGWMAAYPADLCADCGADQITTALSAELGLPAQNMSITSSHTHAAPSTIAKGGAWYYAFVRDQVKASVTAAVEGLADSPPARLETGTATAKAFNVDRRIKNRAVPDAGLPWLRLVAPGQGQGQDRTLATIGAFSVHPTVRNANAELHSGLVGPFTRRVEAELGGTALFVPQAIGDQTPDKSYGVNGMGIGLADALLGDVARGGYVLRSNDLEVAATKVAVPVENSFFLGALGAGYAVRDFLPPYGGGPLAVSTENSSSEVPVCQGAGSTHVITPVSAVRFGARPPAGKVELGEEYRLPVAADNVVVVQSPGEMFASIGLIVKDYLSRSGNVLVQGMTNDTIGYTIPANQYDPGSSQGLGLVGNATDAGNYEEALSLGRCTGELITNAMLDVGAQLGVMGEGEAR